MLDAELKEGHYGQERNSIGPNTVPCGAPEVTDGSLEKLL